MMRIDGVRPVGGVVLGRPGVRPEERRFALLAERIVHDDELRAPSLTQSCQLFSTLPLWVLMTAPCARTAWAAATTSVRWSATLSTGSA